MWGMDVGVGVGVDVGMDVGMDRVDYKKVDDWWVEQEWLWEGDIGEKK